MNRSRRRWMIVGSASAVCAVACTLGDPSVYARGDLDGGSVDMNTTSSSSASSSSGSVDAASPLEDAASDAPTPDAATDADIACAALAAGAVWVGTYAQDTDTEYYQAAGGSAFGVGAITEFERRSAAPLGTPVDLAGQTYASCLHCVIARLDDGRVFFQESGTSTITFYDSNTGQTQATVSNVVLRESTTTQDELEDPIAPIAGGACLTAAQIQISYAGAP